MSKPLQTLAESIGSISVANSAIKLQTSIKNLGVYLDSRLSFNKQVSEICKVSYFHIRALRHIRSSLTTEAAKTIALATVGWWLDYCNSLPDGTSVSNLVCLSSLFKIPLHALWPKSHLLSISTLLAFRIGLEISTLFFLACLSWQ